MSFGKNIKKLRREANMTQEQLAALLSISPQAVSRWETDVAMPDISLLPAIANTFHVSTDYLLDMDKNHNEAMIAEVIKNPIPHKMDIPFDEYFSSIKNLVRNNPANLKLKKTLIMLYALQFSVSKEKQTAKALREFRNLCLNMLSLDINDDDREDILEFLSVFSDHLTGEESLEIEKQIQKNKIGNCSEVLLPLFLSDEKRVEANKNLLFECARYMIQAIYGLYKDFELLTDQEVQALEQNRHIMDSLYGKDIWIIGAEELIPRMTAYGKNGDFDVALQTAEEMVQSIEKQLHQHTVKMDLLLPQNSKLIQAYCNNKTAYDIVLKSRCVGVVRKAIQETFPEGSVDIEKINDLMQRLSAIENQK